MFTSQMSLAASALALSGVASAALARAPMSDFTHTHSAPPQELGSTTSDGFFVHTMNYCTVVTATACRTDLSTGGRVPESTGNPYPLPPQETLSSLAGNASEASSTAVGSSTTEIAATVTATTGDDDAPDATDTAAETAESSPGTDGAGSLNVLVSAVYGVVVCAAAALLV